MSYVHFGVVEGSPGQFEPPTNNCNFKGITSSYVSCLPPIGVIGTRIAPTFNESTNSMSSIALACIKQMEWEEVVIMYELGMGKALKRFLFYRFIL